jgi:hypothetical protein
VRRGGSRVARWTRATLRFNTQPLRGRWDVDGVPCPNGATDWSPGLRQPPLPWVRRSSIRPNPNGVAALGRACRWPAGRAGRNPVGMVPGQPADAGNPLLQYAVPSGQVGHRRYSTPQRGGARGGGIGPCPNCLWAVRCSVWNASSNPVTFQGMGRSRMPGRARLATREGSSRAA